MTRWMPVLLCALLFVVVGCRATPAATPTPNPAVQMTLTLEPSPPQTGDAAILVTLQDGAGTPIDGAQVAVRGDMTHAGMQPVFGEATTTEAPGVYRVPFTWTMGGDWIVTVTATLPDGTSAEQVLNTRVRS